jgi:hypothetical protein
MTDTSSGPKKQAVPLGRRRRISFARQLMVDVMAFADSVPAVAVERTMNLDKVAQARQSNPDRPPWSGIFAKAFGIVAQEIPALRSAYISVPIPHIFEYAETFAFIAQELEVSGEETVIPVRIRSPETTPLNGFRFKIEEMYHADLWSQDYYRSLRRVGYLPVFLRRIVWWTVLNVPRLRKRCFGTFVVTSIGGFGSDSLHARAAISPLLTYGTIGDDGRVKVRLFFDHRILDGAKAARALLRLENVLLGQIHDELRHAECESGV